MCACVHRCVRGSEHARPCGLGRLKALCAVWLRGGAGDGVARAWGCGAGARVWRPPHPGVGLCEYVIVNIKSNFLTSAPPSLRGRRHRRRHLYPLLSLGLSLSVSFSFSLTLVLSLGVSRSLGLSLLVSRSQFLSRSLSLSLSRDLGSKNAAVACGKRRRNEMAAVEPTGGRMTSVVCRRVNTMIWPAVLASSIP